MDWWFIFIQAIGILAWALLILSYYRKDTNKILVDNIIEAGLSSKLDMAALDNFTSISNARDQVYQLIDTMAQDSSVSAILKTYAENVCEPSDNGHVIWCEANDPKISKFINISSALKAKIFKHIKTHTLCKN